MEQFAYCQRPLYTDACGALAFQSELKAVDFAVYRSAAMLATLINASFYRPLACEWIEKDLAPIDHENSYVEMTRFVEMGVKVAYRDDEMVQSSTSTVLNIPV